MSEPVSIEVLRQRFRSELVNPFGEVLVIPSRLFQRSWESALEGQGHRVYAGDYNGETAFLVRLDKSKPKNGNMNRFSVSAKVEDNKPNVENPASSGTSNRFDNSSKAKDKAEWKRWTLWDTQRLQEMLQQNVNVEDIAKTLERTTTSVERKVQRLGLKLPEGAQRATVFQVDANEGFVVKVAHDVEETCKLVEVGFEYVTGEYNDGGKIFRKRK